jgi:arylsulfatase A-like enzyme
MPLILPFGRKLNVVNWVGDDLATQSDVGLLQVGQGQYLGGWVKFTRGRSVTSVCAPGRAAGFTGLLPHKHLVTGNGFGGSLDWMKCYFTDLARAGYTNFVTGKLLNGYGEKPGTNGAFEIATPFPQLGIHRACIMHCSPSYALLPNTSNDYIDEAGNITLGAPNRVNANDPGPGELVGDAHYTPDCWWDYAAAAARPGRDVKSFITDCLTRPGQPWSVYVGDKASHVPVTPATRYTSTSIAFADNAAFGVDPATTGHPPFIVDMAAPPQDWTPEAIQAAHDSTLQRLRTVRASDDSLKALMDFLNANNLLDKTIIILRGDQTDFGGELRIDGGKGTQHPASASLNLRIRMPVAAGSPNYVCDAAVCDMDVAATIRDVCGARAKFLEDGMSMAPLLINPARAFREASPSFALSANPRYEGLNFADGVTWGRGIPGTNTSGQEYTWPDTWATYSTGASPSRGEKLDAIKAAYGYA